MCAFPVRGSALFLLVSMAKRDKQLRIDTLSTNPTNVVSLVGNSVGVHSITQHSGTLLDAQAPQFLKTDGTRDLTGNLAVAAGITIDGVDISDFKSLYDAHAVDPDAHHKAATQGNGIAIDSNQVVSARLASVSGLGFDGTGALVLDDGIAGAGIAISSKVLAVDLASVSGLAFTVGGQLAVADSIAGTGLGINSKVLSVKKATVSGLNFDGTGALLIDDSIAGNGLAITNKVVRVNEGYAFNWTATHTWDSDTLVVNAEQDAVWINSGTPDGSAAFKVTPAATNDFGIYLKQLAGQTASLMRVEDASGNALITLTGGGKLQSGTPAFVSGLTGWEIAPNGTAEFNNVFVRGELHATVFSADEMHAQSGTQIIATATRVAAPISVADNVLPALNSTFTLVVQASWDTGLCYFANNQILVVKTMMATSGGGLDLYEIYMVVNGTPTSNGDRDLTNGKPGTFDVVVTRRYGGATGIAIPAGTGVVKWGVVGGSSGTYTGAILLTSDLNGAPYIDIFTVAADVSGSATWSAPPTITPRVREGLLSGVLGLGTEWGIAMGTDLSASGLSARYVVVSDQRVKLQNVDQTVYQSNTPRISLAATGNVKFGTDTDASATTTFDFIASTGSLRVGPGSGGASLQWTGSALEVRNSSASAVITLDGSGNSYFSGVMTLGTSGEIRQGTGTVGTNYTGLRLWRSGSIGLIAGYNANTIQWQGDTDGKLKAGAGTVMLSANGVDLAAYIGSNPNPTDNVKSLTFWGNLSDAGSATVKPAGRIWGANNVLGQYGVQIEAFHPTETNTYPKLWVSYDALGYKRNLTATDFDNVLLTAAEAIYLTGSVTVTGNVTVAGHYIPNTSLTYDIGSASKTVRKLYVSEIIADTITGGTQITGSIWQYDSGDMYIRSNSATTRTLYVANPSTGTMHLDVEGNILVGGTVDGVDVSVLNSNYTTHVADSNIHHNKSHELASSAGLGTDHTVSGLTTGHVLRASGATTAAFAQLGHSELSGLTSGDPHTQYVAIGTARTITAQHTFAPASVLPPFVLGANAQGQTVVGFKADQLNRSVTAGVGLSGGGTLTADITISMGMPSSLSASSANSVSGTTHSHVIDSTIARSAITIGVSGLGLSGGGDLTANRTITLTSSSAPGAAASVLASSASGQLTLPLFVASTSLTTPSLTSSAALAITSAAGDISLDASTDNLLIGASNTLKTTNYASQTTGWGISYAGGADFRYLFVDEMHAKSFIADLEQALAGGQIISKSVAMLYASFTAPAAGAATTLTVRDLPSATGMAAFQNGDFVRLRTFSRAAGSLTIADCWGTVTLDTTYGTSGFDSTTKTQRYTFTRSAGTIGAGNAPGGMAAATTVQADSIVLDYGVSGNGFYEINAIDGVYGANSPYWQIVKWTTHPATGQTVNVRGGNLTGITSTANEYGIIAGSGGFAATNSWVKFSSVGMVLNSVDSLWRNAGTLTVNIQSDGDIFAGSDVSAAATTSFAHFATSQTYASEVMGAGDIVIGNKSAGHMFWDASTGTLNFRNNTTVQAYVDTSGRIVAGGGNIVMDSSALTIASTITANGSGITFYQSSVPRISLAATGNAKLGTDTSAVATTTFDFVASSGALRIGPGSGGASLQWTGSALEVRNSSASAVITLDGSGNSYFSGVMTLGTSGEIRQGTGTVGTNYTGLRLWRSGSIGLIAGYNTNVVQWQGDTDGKLKAGAGTVMLSANGVDLVAYTGSNPNPTDNVKSLTFWGNLSDAGSATVKPAGRVWGASNVSGQYGIQIEAFHPTETNPYPKLWVSYDALGYKRNLTATDFDNILLTAGDTIYLTGSIAATGNLTVAGHYIPNVSLTYDIGSASKTVRKLYVSEIIADTITSGTQISGSIWQYDAGDMYIRSNATTTRTLYVANPGTGTMNLDVEGNITVGGTVDGVDVAVLNSNYTAHVSDSNIHHNKSHVLATTSALGSDHTVSGLTAGQVLKATGATTAVFVQLDHSELAGLTSGDPHTQYVAIGTARTITAQHTFAPGSALAPFVLSANAQGQTVVGFKADQLNRSVTAGVGLSGGGTLTADITVSMGTPSTLTQSSTNSASGTTHSHAITSSNSPGAAASILASSASGKLTLPLFVASTSLTTPSLTSSAALAITTAAGNISLDASTDLISIGASNALQTANYASQTTGWGISYAGGADFRYLFVNEMHTKSFIADLEQALAGGQIISKSVAMLYANFTAPAAGATATLIVRDLPSATGMAAFQNGDFVRIRTFSRAAGSLTIADCWGTVTLDNSWTFAVTATGGTFTMTVGANTTTAIAYNASAATLQTALTGLASVGAGNCTVSKVSSTFTINFVGTLAGQSVALTANVASLTGGTGTLTANYGTGGFDGTTKTQQYVFTRSSGTIGAGNAPGGMAATTVVQADALVLDYGVSGNGFYEINAIDGTYGANSPYWQVVKWTTHPATGQTVNARGGKLTGVTGNANEYGMIAGSGGFTATDSWVKFSSAGVVLNSVDSLWRNAGTLTVNIQSDGDIFAGSNAGAVATTSFAHFATSQSYGGETMGAGDIVIGNKSAGHMFWDASTGTLNFRNNTTVQAYINTSGQMVAGSGNIVMDSSALTIAGLITADANGITLPVHLYSTEPSPTGGLLSYNDPKRIHQGNLEFYSYSVDFDPLTGKRTGATIRHVAPPVTDFLSGGIPFSGSYSSLLIETVGYSSGVAKNAYIAMYAGNDNNTVHSYIDIVTTEAISLVATDAVYVSTRLKLGGALSMSASGYTSYVSNNVDVLLYYTASGGTYPFDNNGHLVIQPRTSAPRDIIFATGSTTPSTRMVIDNAGNTTLYGNLGWSSGGFAAAWTALTYNTNWSSYGGAYGSMRYTKIGDLVLVNGMAKRTSGNSTVTVGTLPSGYRPTTQKSWYTNMSVGGVEAAYKIEVTSGGNIAITYSGTAVIDYLSLDCIQFRTNS